MSAQQLEPQRRPGRTPDVVPLAAGALCIAVAAMVLWGAYGGRMDRGVLGVAIPLLLVLVGAGCLMVRGRGN
ncbi:hypothetical protein [Enemella evansiae]|uniref:Uncharacterized protein n=1 Tax=Enemella evansiae TaxID=2016499 RepID=A0A255GC15_9ACTN|nr:hypothetical protein [Enemella evansiae]PFG68387.1 hypothetical protein B0O41_3223 [Propionibacteriaceae bacterium ES.041]OYN95570.1 hypothetical protein CGZ95_17875 [Enemella evansiae]OYO00335.1 hypothetical protein CGZ96_05310 [Enemella evansiae]OYO03675.1 hypothetical protein CGZ97_09645 [Enemella evansiae]OYO10103.1 hypothetical protein CGZ98_13500 [Enemella evansiae]